MSRDESSRKKGERRRRRRRTEKKVHGWKRFQEDFLKTAKDKRGGGKPVLRA